ncbi:MAG: response regulator [Candidatus Omnitrophica bacterium]|nr:response regulator [Candidatus Omnitrophota bacterium]
MPKKILIVDDDPSLCNSFTMLLRSEGYSVDATTDSLEGEILVKKNKYDICLFDYKMKGLNGKDLLKITKNGNPLCSVFIVSAMTNIEELCKKEIKADLVAGIISKPFYVEELLQKIAAIDQDSPH